MLLNTAVEDIVIVLPAALYIAPPCVAEFLSNIASIAFVITPLLYIAPPAANAVLYIYVVPKSVIVPALYIAPPPLTKYSIPFATLFLNTADEDMVIVLPAALYIAPPDSALLP